MRTTCVVAWCLLFCSAAAVAQERPELWTGCKQMRSFAYVPDDGAARKVALTGSILRAAAESRLRSARLYADDAEHVLWIGLDMLDASAGPNRRVVGVAFTLRLQFVQRLWDPPAETWRIATTWQDSLIGMTEADIGGRPFILSALAGQLDRFLVEYLRANEDNC